MLLGLQCRADLRFFPAPRKSELSLFDSSFFARVGENGEQKSHIGFSTILIIACEKKWSEWRSYIFLFSYKKNIYDKVCHEKKYKSFLTPISYGIVQWKKCVAWIHYTLKNRTIILENIKINIFYEPKLSCEIGQ